MTNIINFIQKRIHVSTLLAAFFMTNITMLVIFRLKEGEAGIAAKFYSSGFADGVSTIGAVITFAVYAVLLILAFAFYPPLNKKRPFLLLISGWIYFFLLIQLITADIYMVFGALVVMAILTYYLVSKNGGLPGLKTKSLVIILCVLFIGIAGFIGMVTVYRYLALVAPGFDFGIFSQMFEYMRTTGVPNTTYERDMLLSHFAVHVSPAFYLILPVYMIFPTPLTLQIMQAVIVASGIFPLFMICRHKKLPNIVTLFILISFAFYPALSGSCMYDIHENMFLTAFVLWLFYFLEKDNLLGVFIFSVLVCTVKEDCAIYVAIIALFMIFAKKKIREGIALFMFAIAYFSLAMVLLEAFGGEGVMLDSRLGIYSDKGMVGVLKAVLLNPAFIIKEALKPIDSSPTKILYIMRMLLPLAFLPLMNKKPANLILFIPFLLMNLMPSWPYQHDVGFQYHFGNCAIFFYLFVVNFSELGSEKAKALKLKKFILIFSMTASIFLFTAERWGSRYIVRMYYSNLDNINIIREVLSEVPQDKSVSVSTFFAAHLSGNKELYELRNENHTTDYIIFDLMRYESSELIAQYEERGYRMETMHEGLIAIMVKE